jgi:hypothetical protein
VREHKCQTPGAHYHISIGPSVVECRVDIPFDLDLDKLRAIDLEKRVHDAMEEVLKGYFSESR